MKGLLLICGLVCVCQAFDRATDRQWEQWKRQFYKHYSPQGEEFTRKEIWLNNLRYVEEHNNKPGVTFHISLNKFADQTPANRPKFQVSHIEDNSIWSDSYRVVDLPPSFDWRKYKNVVPPVRNQGQIGSALALDATDAVESYTAIHSGHLYNLSIQQFAQCCSTHLLGNSFKCIHDMGGLCLASAKFSSCSSPGCQQLGQIGGGDSVKTGDENDLQRSVLITPVLVGVDASHASFQLYTGGVYNEPNCSSTMLDHTLLLVGYGSDSTGNDYWICQNTWGLNWGLNGYILMSRNKKNQCGIATYASYPV